MMRRAGLVVLAAAVAISSFAKPAPAQDVRKLVTVATPGRIRSISVCGTSGLAAGLAGDGSIYVWRLPPGELEASWKIGSRVSALACSFDGKWLATGKGDGSVEITDAAGKPARTLAVAHTRIDNLAFSPDGSLLAVSASEEPVQLWNPRTGALVAELHTDFNGSTGMDFAPDSSSFATSDSDTAIRIYDRNGKIKVKYSGLVLEPFAISFLPDGKEVVVGGADGTLTFLDTSDGHVVRQLPQHPDPIFWVIALPDRHSLVSLNIDAARLERFTVILWNLPTNVRRDLAIDGKNLVGYGEIASHEPVLFTADSDSSLTAWEITQ